MIRKLIIGSLIIGLIVTATGLVGGLYFYFRLTRDLPRMEKISDYVPKAVSSIYAEDGTLIGEIYEEKRYPVPFSEIPPLLKNAFLAAEDANFYRHPGIDFISILRAVWVNLRKKSNVQGASTITQQVVKSLLLTKEKTYERKIKEAILSYRIEQALTKDEIFSIYLNEIYLGSNAYGVQAASRTHFHKDLKDLNLAEIAFLAGLPPKPSAYSKKEHREEALGRQHYVLDQMLKNQMISPEEAKEAREFTLTLYPANNQKIFHAPYYVSHVISLLGELEATRKENFLTNPGGYQVYTTADLRANTLAQAAVRRGLLEVDKRRGWKGPLTEYSIKKVAALLGPEATGGERANSILKAYWTECQAEKEVGRCPKREEELIPGRIYRALVTGIKGNKIEVMVGDFRQELDLKNVTWAKKLLDKNDRSTWIDIPNALRVGHVIEVSLENVSAGAPESPSGETRQKFILDQTPELEGAFVLSNVDTGAVTAIIGGYDYQRSEFNRATQGLRQPGSAFKPFIYLAAVEQLHYTPVTIVPDSPISLVAGNGEMWTPGNFDHKFLGPITLRTALERSRNVVSVYLLNQMGVDRGIESARKFGITTPIGRDLSISLGTPEVKLLELVRAYSVFPAKGWLSESLVITEIKDRSGKTIFKQGPKQKKVISDEDAFIMTNMMKGVVDRGTATILKALGRPIGGKTGTTNEQMDAWFVGFSPEWSAGAWVGFDVKRTIGRLETGGKAAAPIFLYFMQEFLKDKIVLDFDIPDGVIPVPINRMSGTLADPSEPDAFFEYFKSGTEPTEYVPTYTGEAPQEQNSGNDYLSHDEF